MRHFTTIAVATIAIAALAAAAPASAQQHPHGGPMKAGVQCWKSHGGAESNYGHFESCARAAGTTATRRAARQRS
jgi:hypothetical protein